MINAFKVTPPTGHDKRPATEVALAHVLNSIRKEKKREEQLTTCGTQYSGRGEQSYPRKANHRAKLRKILRTWFSGPVKDLEHTASVSQNVRRQQERNRTA